MKPAPSPCVERGENEPLGYEASDKEVESDLESTTKSKPKCKKFKKTPKDILDCMFRDCPYFPKNEGNGNGGNDGCSYKTFTTCNPKEFDGKGSAVALTRWIEKIESVFENSGCTTNQRVRGREAAIGMSWNDFKALLVEEFCPSNEMEN
ncbi:hypothetical protein Tco_1176156 [Tanacetum coccineum]